MTNNSFIQEHFGASVPIEIIRWNLKLLYNHSDYIADTITWEYKEIITEILSNLSIYEQARIYLVKKQYEQAREWFKSIKRDNKYYWSAQFQLGKIAKIENSHNHFLRSRLYWNSIPKESTAYWDAQFALGSLGKTYYEHLNNVPKWHKRYFDSIWKLWSIAAISGDKINASNYFHKLPDNYPNSWDFQKLFPQDTTSLH